MSTAAGKRILIVEDEPILAMMLEDIILDLGGEVIGPALRLDSALELARTAKLDAAILDVNIGESRSYGVADILAARQVPYLFATGYDAKGLELSGRTAFILAKPYRQGDIEAALGDLLGERKALAGKAPSA